MQIGCRGGGPGQLTWPRGVAVGPDDATVVADSSNRRVQVLDQQGAFVREFGQHGSGEAEFHCPAGVAVSRIGQFSVSDRSGQPPVAGQSKNFYIQAFTAKDIAIAGTAVRLAPDVCPL